MSVVDSFVSIERARNLARVYHADQYNKFDGEVYWKHPERVALDLCYRGYSSDFIAVAWLHDIIEDTAYSEEQLMSDFSPEISEAVMLLTKQGKNVDLGEYYRKIRENELARVVKLADIRDNLGRIDNIHHKDTATRLKHKYSLGINILES